MINLNLTKHELHVLSNFSKVSMSRGSMLLDKQLEEIFDFEGEHYYQAYQRMVRDGFITGSGNEEGLAKEFEPLFMLLLQPECSLQVRKLVKDDYGAVTFSFSHGFGVMIEQSDDGSIYVLSYPYSKKGMDDWVNKITFGECTFEPSGLQPHTLSLTMDECLLLDVLLCMLKNRVIAKGGPLNKEEAVVTVKDLAAFDATDLSDGILIRGLGQVGISEFLANPTAMASVEGLLSDKGIIEVTDEGILISDLGKEIFNPGKIKDCILLAETTGEEKHLAAVYIMTDGYLTMETEGSGESMVNTISTYPPDSSVEALMQKLTTEEFRKGFGG